MKANTNPEHLASTNSAHAITVISSTGPARVGKAYSIGPDGKLAKTSVASIWQGRATTIEATPENIVAALKQATKSENQVIALDSFIGVAPGSPEINIVTREELERLTGGEIVAPAPGGPGCFDTEGMLYSARLKRLMRGAGWMLFDADSPDEMPDAWRRLTLAERLALFDKPGLLPGISKCLRIEYRGSSARVVNGSDRQSPGASHALIQVSDASMIDPLVRLHVRVQSVVQDLAFKAARLSSDEPGKIIGHAHLTLFDWSVWVLGRLVFNAKPDVSKAPGYRVLDADVKIVNPDGGVLDIGWIEPPDPKAMAAFRAKTGRDIRLSDGTGKGSGTEIESGKGSGRGRGGFALHEYGTLKLDTKLRAGGTVKPLADWLVEMLDGDIEHLRCEAPFRASISEAAFIRIAPDGEVFVHDSGMTTNYYLDPLPQTEGEAAAEATSTGFGVYEMTAAVMEARTRQRQRRAKALFTVITDEELAAMAAAAKRPSLDDVQQAAKALKEGDLDGAGGVFDLLMQVKERTDANDDMIVNAVKKALGANGPRKESIRGMLKDATARLASEEAALREASFIWASGDDDEGDDNGEEPAWVTEMNARYAFIRDRAGGVLDLAGTDTAVVRMLSLKEFDNIHANQFPPGEDRRKGNVASRWFRHRLRREYATAGDYPVGAEPEGALNLWEGLPVEPKAGKWPTIEEFLFAVICAGGRMEFDYLRDLLFWKLQNPTLNPEVAISLGGTSGNGKGTFARLFLERLFGARRCVQFLRPDDAGARFNAEAEGKLVLFYDETFFAHDPKIRGRMKGEITEPRIPIEPKQINRYYVKNLALRVYASNDAAPVPVDHDDRRILVLAVSNIHARDRAYFTRVRVAIAGNELAAFTYDALHADLSAFGSLPPEPLKTKAKAALAAATAKPEYEFIFELLDRGGPPGSSYNWQPRRYPRVNPEPPDPWRDGQVTVERDAPHKMYLDWLKSAHPKSRPVNTAEFYTTIQQALGAAMFRTRPVRDGSDNKRMLVIRSLDECRAAFDQHAGFPYAWF